MASKSAPAAQKPAMSAKSTAEITAVIAELRDVLGRVLRLGALPLALTNPLPVAPPGPPLLGKQPVLDPMHATVLRFIVAHRASARSDIRRAVHLRKDQLSYVLKVLRRRGLIQSVGNRAGTRYVATPTAKSVEVIVQPPRPRAKPVGRPRTSTRGGRWPAWLRARPRGRAA